LENNLPLVSIVITNYNREKTIATAIESALAQDYPNLEIIISDNCSTDKSDEIISRYTGDSRVRYSVNETNIGMLANFRLAISHKAQGKYFTIVNSDDELINPHFISDCIHIINKGENILLVKGASFHKRKAAGKYHLYKSLNDIENGLTFFKHFRFNQDFGWAGVLIERAYIGQYDLLQNNATGCDYFINLKLALLGNIGFVKTPSYQFNIHESNLSHTAYTFPQIDELFGEIEKLFDFFLDNKLGDAAAATRIKEEYQYCYVANIIEDYYYSNRPLLNKVNERLNAVNPRLVKRFYSSKRWYLYAATFFNKGLGDKIIHIKWTLKNSLFS
jgi:glycosyltransferase involved in cell wall biosynthesis